MGTVGTTGSAVRIARVERRRLLRRLRVVAQVPVVVIHAAAGFGKTTLVEQWGEADPRPHLLVRMTPARDDPVALTLALTDALEPIGPGVGALRSIVTASDPPSSASLVSAVTQLVQSRGRPYVLVLDDAHLMTRPACHALVAAAVQAVPPGSQVVLVGRDAPPCWLARTMAEGHLVSLGPRDLALDEQESRAILDSLAPGLAAEQVDDIVDRADGWPVALCLLAGEGDGGRPVAPGRPPGARVDPLVQDYLVVEVLAGLDEPTLEFLRLSSVLDDVTAPLADHVLQRHDSAVVLSHLARHLQLVVPQEERGRYRYHHLLTDALREDLRAHEPWREPELHRRASAWFESHADLDAAIRHAKAAHDLELTGRLVWCGVPACISSGRPDRLASWLADLDDAHVRSNRWLVLAAAWSGLQGGDPDRMTHWVLAAEAHAGPQWRCRVADDTYAAFLACLHLTIGDFGLEGSLALATGAEQGLPRDSGFRASALHHQGVTRILLGRYREGADSLQQAERLGRALHVPVIEANALAWQGLLAVMRDDWARAATSISRAGDLVRLHQLDRLATSANVVTALALLQATRGARAEARSTLCTARRLTVDVSRIAPWFAVLGPLVQARTAIVLDDPALARSLCAEARRHLTTDLEHSLLPELLADTEGRLRAYQDDRVFAQSLTPAQLRVLQFLPTRLTFDQIGEHLFLSRATVKSHAAAIYRKLGAATRDEAVARARSLGLVESARGD